MKRRPYIDHGDFKTSNVERWIAVATIAEVGAYSMSPVTLQNEARLLSIIGLPFDWTIPFPVERNAS